MVPVGVHLSEKDMRALGERCKRCDVLISGAEDIREQGRTAPKTYEILCRKDDLARFTKLFEEITNERRCSLIKEEIEKYQAENVSLETKIEEIKSKGDLSAEDITDVAELQERIKVNNNVIARAYDEISSFREKGSQELNTEQVRSVCEHAVNGNTSHGIPFDEAMNRFTGQTLDRDTTYYVVDMKDPARFIECNSMTDTFKGKEYTKTTYDAFVGSEKVCSRDDGRFEGRPSNYWSDVKQELKEAGGFGDRVLKFNSSKDFEDYRVSVQAQNTRDDLSIFEGSSQNKDYAALITKLEGQIEACGAKYVAGKEVGDENSGAAAKAAGTVVDKETGAPLSLPDNVHAAEYTNAAEAIICAKQIDVYQEMSALELQMSYASVKMNTETQGTPAFFAAEKEYAVVSEKWEAAKGTEKALLEERKAVNSAQSVQEVTKNKEVERGKGRSEGLYDLLADEKGSEKNGTKAQYKKEIDHRKSEMDKYLDQLIAEEKQKAKPKGEISL